MIIPTSNKVVLRRHFDEVLNHGRLGVIDEIYATDYVLVAPVQTDGSVQKHGETRGRDGLKRRVMLFRTAFPDIQFTIEDMLAEGDRVAVHYSFSGTQTGQFGDLAPTRRKVSVPGIMIAVVREGRIESAFSAFDSGDMLRQLDVADGPVT